jgi:hypothetical protein
VTAAVGLVANALAGNIRDENGDDADCVLVGLNEQSIGVNYQATADHFPIISAGVLIIPMSKKMPKEDNGIAFEGCEPSTLFREFAAESIELAQAVSSPEKHALYMKMASVWHQMAQRWEKKRGLPVSRQSNRPFAMSALPQKADIDQSS